MQDAIRDMLRWSVGFCIVSTVYLVVAMFLVRRFQKKRAPRKETADTPHTATPPNK